jgi:hypothetical protein
LAVEPLLASLRLRLTGISLPWGFYKTGAFADDLTVGLTRTDVPILRQVLADYGRASNGRTNDDKSMILDLTASTTTPVWIRDTGFTVQDPTLSFRVLGFDLLLSPAGVQEDWSALYSSMHAIAHRLTGRSCALRGRALLAQSLVLSKLWYKGQLSSPTAPHYAAFRRLGLEVVWGGSVALKPGVSTMRRHRLKGGVASWIQQRIFKHNMLSG